MVKTHWEYHTHLIADRAYFECKVSFLWTYEHTGARFFAVKPLSLCLCSVWVIFTSAVADVGEQSVWKRGRSMWTSQSLHVCAELSEEVIRLKDVSTWNGSCCAAKRIKDEVNKQSLELVRFKSQRIKRERKTEQKWEHAFITLRFGFLSLGLPRGFLPAGCPQKTSKGRRSGCIQSRRLSRLSWLAFNTKEQRIYF